MRTRLTIEHLSGSKAGKTECLTIAWPGEIFFGRDPECDVKYGETDELVSRKHLKIVVAEAADSGYTLVDLGSRNGTFVNRQRVFGAVHLAPGGHVQLGPGGPEFAFGAGSVVEPSPEPRRPKVAWKRVMEGLFVLLLIAASGAAGYVGFTSLAPVWRNWRLQQEARSLHLQRIRTAILGSVTPAEIQWSLIEKKTGARLAHAYVSNERLSRSSVLPLLEGGRPMLPAFVLGPDRVIKPLLVPVGSEHAGKAIAGNWTSYAVGLSNEGTLITAAPCQLPWIDAQEPDESAGVLLLLDSAQRITQVAPLAAAQFPHRPMLASVFVAEHLSADSQAGLEGRSISKGDLEITTKLSFTALNRTAAGQLVNTHEVSPFALARDATLQLPGKASIQPENGKGVSFDHKPVFVVGRDIESGDARSQNPGGMLTIRAPHCGEGRVVFDQEGHLLGLCLPNSEAGSSLAVPIERALAALEVSKR